MAAARSCEGWAAVWMTRFGPQFGDEGEQAVAVFGNIEGLVAVAGDIAAEALQHPTGIALGTEEEGAVVAVDAGNFEPLAGEEDGDFRTDQSAGA